MRITPPILISCCIIFIWWCTSGADWLVSKKHRHSIQTRGHYSLELSQRRLPLSTCTDCYKFKDKRLHVRHREYQQESDGAALESLHDAIIVIATVVIATSWITVFTLCLHSRIQRNLDQRFRAIVIAQLDPHQTFMDTRRQG